jgi:hypothetical protein
MTLLLIILVAWLLLNAIYVWWMADGRYRRSAESSKPCRHPLAGKHSLTAFIKPWR